MSVSKIDAIIEKLKAICERHKPTISYIFYFPWKGGPPKYVCGVRKPSKKFALMVHVVRSGGKLEDAVKTHLEKYADDPMDLDDSAEKHTANYQKIYDSACQATVTHCADCKKGWETKIVAEAIGVNPDIESWNDYVHEVVLLRTTIEKAQFCTSVDEHFPPADDLLEYGSEYCMRKDEMISLFEYLGDTTHYFAAEYWERQQQKMMIYSSGSGGDNELPGMKYLIEEF